MYAKGFRFLVVVVGGCRGAVLCCAVLWWGSRLGSVYCMNGWMDGWMEWMDGVGRVKAYISRDMYVVDSGLFDRYHRPCRYVFLIIPGRRY